ncbi:hypothetical protein [Mycolicibacterium llatzerense]|uniref:hypothetical protein n=1 Tax=Mycolicibacterium llatzerense TaxID=280871 RepID=UPI0021B51442|nr:hypothetical protein [Mycolicibacterium llatzerense]MCT7367307.1 hypothetical protein [Mycolicibacterium llatzerense]
MTNQYDIHDQLPHLIRRDRNIPGWMNDQTALQTTGRTLTLCAGIFGAIVVAGAGPDLMFPANMTAATLGTLPWVALWTVAVLLGAWHVNAAAMQHRMRAASRELRFESLSRATDYAEDILTLSGHGPADAIWRVMAAAPLTAIVYAASTRGNGEGMPWVRETVERLSTDGAAGWHAAADAVADIDERLQPHLDRWVDSDARQRDSVALVMREAVGGVAGARA